MMRSGSNGGCGSRLWGDRRGPLRCRSSRINVCFLLFASIVIEARGSEWSYFWTLFLHVSVPDDEPSFWKCWQEILIPKYGLVIKLLK